MAEVFNKTVGIRLTREALDAMEKAAKEFEQKKAPLQDRMNQLVKEFGCYLEEKGYKIQAVQDYTYIAGGFGDFLYMWTDVLNIEEVTGEMANSHFRKWYNRHSINDKRTARELKSAMYVFFTFLAEEKGLKNEAALKVLKPRSTRASLASPIGFVKHD
jgi:hypothetical protein